MKSNRIKSICVILCLTFFALACSTSVNKKHLRVFEEFPEIIELQGKPIKTGEEKYNPLLMGLKDHLLVICDIENDPYFHVYALPEFEYLGNFGQQGKGPSEFQNPLFWGQFEKSERKKIWVFDGNSLTFSLIDVLDAIHNENYKAETNLVLPNEAVEAIIVLRMEENSLLGSGAFFHGEFFVYDTKTNQIQWIAQNTDYNNSFRQLLETTNEYYDLSTLKQGITKIKPDQSRFVKALVSAPVMDVYKPDGKLEFTIIQKDFELPASNEKEIDITKSWYENIFLTDSYIYALNRNCALEQYSLEECNDAEIHVFNWSGEPVALFRLNEGIGLAAPFVIDEVNKKIYTVNPRDENHLFSAFDFSHNAFLVN